MAEWVDEVRLIGLTENEDKRVNENGFATAGKENETMVFCNIKSVGYSEYFKSQQTGKAVELKCEVHKEDYNGEDEAEIVSTSLRKDLAGKRFFVLKTYETGEDVIELSLTDIRHKESRG